MTAAWKFPLNNGGEEDGPQNAAIDTFKGRHVFSLVRETIQNSMDVAISGKTAIVSYTLNEIQASRVPEIQGLSHWLELARARAIQIFNGDGNNKYARFYRSAKDSVDSDRVTIFGIHDYNTTGLTGPISGGTPGPWRALVKGSGLSIKSSADAGGSFGHGSKAPFAVSAPQSVFYYTELGGEQRFQGKSILLSMETAEGITQGTGYYGVEDQLQPLLNDNVPWWAQELRPQIPDVPAVGTSIYVPSPLLNEDEATIWDRIVVAVFVNFSYALRNGNLEVRLGDGTVMNRESIDSLSARFEEILVNTGWNSDTDGLDGLEASRVVGSAKGDCVGSFESSTFGHVQWFLDISDECRGQEVAVLRRGMFITDEALRLQRFPGTRPFRLVVSVEGKDGSTTLRSLENPEHTKFEYSRISDATERKTAKKNYEKFTDEVRALVMSRAALDATEEIFISDLDFLFNSGGQRSRREDGGDMSRKQSVGAARLRPVQRGAEVEVDEPGNGTGFTGGDGTVETPGGPNPSPTGAISPKSKRPKGKQVEDLRVVRRDPDSNVVHVSFTPVIRGHFKFSLYRSGENDREAIQFKIGERWVRETTLDAKDLGRRTLRLELDPVDFNYAYEGVMFDASES